MFSIPMTSISRARTSVVLAENAIAVVILLLVINNENAIVVETSYQMLEVLLFSSMKIRVLTFSGQKK